MSSLAKTGFVDTKLQQQLALTRRGRPRYAELSTVGGLLRRPLLFLPLVFQLVSIAESAAVVVEKTIWITPPDYSEIYGPLLCDVEWSLGYTTNQEQEEAKRAWRVTVFIEDRKMESWSNDNISCANSILDVVPGFLNDDFCAVVATRNLEDGFQLERFDWYISGGYRFRFVWERNDEGQGEKEAEATIWGYTDFMIHLPDRVASEKEKEIASKEWLSAVSVLRKHPVLQD